MFCHKCSSSCLQCGCSTHWYLGGHILAETLLCFIKTVTTHSHFCSCWPVPLLCITQFLRILALFMAFPVYSDTFCAFSHMAPVSDTLLEYQKQLLNLFQFFCVPKRGAVESIACYWVTQKGISRVLEFNIGLIAASFSSLCLDVSACISSKQNSIYAIQNPTVLQRVQGEKIMNSFKFLFVNMLENSLSCKKFSLTTLFPSLCAC